MMENDKNPSYGTMKQSHINGSNEEPKVVTAKMLRDNFYTEVETDALLAGKADRRVVVTETVTADWEYHDYGHPFTEQELTDELDTLLDGWDDEAAAVTLVAQMLTGEDITGATVSMAFHTALHNAMAVLETGCHDTYEPRNVVSSDMTLGVDRYVDFGEVAAVTLALPASVSRADEFICAFTCATDACVLTLPAGVVLGNGLDFEADRAAGRKFQLSIMDGIALYTYIDPLA